MSVKEFPNPNRSGHDAGINSQIAGHRAKPMVLRNNRLFCWFTMSASFFTLFLAGCMVILVLSEVFPLSALTAAKGMNAVMWAFCAIYTGFACPWLWYTGRALANYEVRLDSRGVGFRLGTKKNPQDLFLAWDQVAAIKQERVGNAQQFFVVGTDGSEAKFSSYMFFRPRRVALLIADRTGQSIQKG